MSADALVRVSADTLVVCWPGQRVDSVLANALADALVRLDSLLLPICFWNVHCINDQSEQRSGNVSN